MKFSTILALALASYTTLASAQQNGDFRAKNADEAEKLTNDFKKLTADSPCQDGENACVGDQFAQCANGKFALTSCAPGTKCVVLPLVNKPGTSVTCDTEADRQARLNDARGKGPGQPQQPQQPDTPSQGKNTTDPTAPAKGNDNPKDNPDPTAPAKGAKGKDNPKDNPDPTAPAKGTKGKDNPKNNPDDPTNSGSPNDPNNSDNPGNPQSPPQQGKGKGKAKNAKGKKEHGKGKKKKNDGKAKNAKGKENDTPQQPDTPPQGKNATDPTAPPQGKNTTDPQDTNGQQPKKRSPAGNPSDFRAKNADEAEKLTSDFKKLTANSPCQEGENACVGDQFAQCANGKFALTSCAPGTKCVVLPLVNKPGTSVTCDTEADRQARLADARGQQPKRRSVKKRSVKKYRV